MNQQNMRKEPTFGETIEVNTTAQEIEVQSAQNMDVKKNEPKKLNLSLHLNKSPGYTFTPILKRPKASAEHLATMEEQAELQRNKQENIMVSPQDNMITNNEDISGLSTDIEKQSRSQASVDEVVEANPNRMERVIPTSHSQQNKAIDKIPSKYRRLTLVGLLGLALLLVFFLLKPKSLDTVEQLQEQSGGLPIEFRPVNEDEAKRAEEEAKRTEEAKRVEESKQLTKDVETLPVPTTAEPVTDLGTVQPTLINGSSSFKTTENTTKVEITAVESEIKPVVVESVKKSETNTNIPSSSDVDKKQVTKKVLVKEKQTQVKTEKSTAAAKSTATEIASSKTLTVPKGVSLMQVFRDNKLNISDVNAMSKVNKAVSNLKVGEKVTIRLDKNNRVAEMRVSAGTYVRQANGTYIFR